MAAVKSSAAGFSLVETLVALAILGIALTGILPSFLSQAQTNSRCAERSGAVLAAQQMLESMRLTDPETMPDEGAAAPQLLTIGGVEYEVVVRYCANEALCNPVSRHITVDVNLRGRKIYDVETIYTQLR